MKKMLLILIAVGVFGGGWFLASRGGVAESHSTDESPGVLQCYTLKDGDAPGEFVTLTTNNFGDDEVLVQEAIIMCEEAIKHPQGSDTPDKPGDHVFECYRIEEGADPNQPVALVTDNFGSDEVVVRRATIMCEGAEKAITDATGITVTFGQPGVHVLACYRLIDGDKPDAPFNLTTDNFGTDEVVVRRAIIMCEEAQKSRVGADGTVTTVGEATGKVWECYSLKEGDDPQTPATLTTENFGPDDVVVRRAVIMCEPAEKILPTPTPTPTPVPTAPPTPGLTPIDGVIGGP